jgi:flagellin-like hook-associated protein FlgL
MALTGIGSSIATSALSQKNMESQLDVLSRQLGTGQKAALYDELGSQAGLAVGLNRQLSAIAGYDNTNSTVTTTLGIEKVALSQIGDVANSVQGAAEQPAAFTLSSNGQTALQANATAQLDQILGLFNTQVGDNYIFSGSAQNQPSVDTTDHILNGNGAQAGLKQVISERNQADVGASGLGRLVIPAAAGSTVSINEDVAGSPFGFKLASVGSSLTGATVTQPTGSPPTATVTLGANPNNGESVQFGLTLPDGTSDTITLQATSAATPGTNQFVIGATPAATAANLQAALTTAVGNLAKTELPAASAVAAAKNFFGSPPQRVTGPSFNSATALQNGTSADTVSWYTGESGATPARQTATAQVGPSTSISFGLRADEPAFTSLLANIGALAATSYAAVNTNTSASYAALTSRVAGNLGTQQGVQSISDIDADIANAAVTATNAQSVNTQTKTTLSDMMQQIEGVSADQIGVQILTLQNNLQASLSTTARLSSLSLVTYLGAA